MGSNAFLEPHPGFGFPHATLGTTGDSQASLYRIAQCDQQFLDLQQHKIPLHGTLSELPLLGLVTCRGDRNHCGDYGPGLK